MKKTSSRHGHINEDKTLVKTYDRNEKQQNWKQ